MEVHDRQDCEGTISRIDQLLACGVFEPANRGHVLFQSAFTELLVCLRNLLFKAEKHAGRIGFTDEVLPNAYVNDITDCVTAMRDAACHINSFKQRFDDQGNRGSFNVAYGKCNLMRIGNLELKSEYEDDFAVFYGANRLYFRRGVLRAFVEARAALAPQLLQR